MRVKADARRRAIMEVAMAAFRERGFADTSMSDLASRVGGSNATLYEHFRSKKALFAAVLLEDNGVGVSPIIEALPDSGDVEVVVREFALKYTQLMLTAGAIALNRLYVAEGERSGFGSQIFDAGPKIVLDDIANRLQCAMDAGELRRVDARRGALHLKALCEAGLVYMRQRGFRDEPTTAEI